MSSLQDVLCAKAAGGEFMPDARFGALLTYPSEPEPPASDHSEKAFEEGYRCGFQDAMVQAQRQAEQDNVARGIIETGFERLSEAEELRLEQRLHEIVLALCEKTLAPLVADPDALTARISKALSLLRRAEDHRVVRLHPDDLALISKRLPDSIKVDPDPTLARGELRIETNDGGVEDGPEQWRRILAEALGL